MARLRASWRTSLPVVQQPRNPQSESIARTPYPARRSTRAEDWVPGRWVSDTHRVAPLTRGLYHADGQMLDEVYNYGSFKQSKMFAAGGTLRDRPEPHRAPP